MNSFKVNEFITLKLEQDETVIYVKEKRFINCKYLLLNIPIDKMIKLEDLQSIDEISDTLDNSLELATNFGAYQTPLIPPEVEFWGHCSNLQVWYEHNYNTSLIHSNLAFPLLKELTDLGDTLARRVFAEEIAKRFDSEYLPVMLYLLSNNYLSYLDETQVTALKFSTKIRKMNDSRSSGNVRRNMLESFKLYLRKIEPKTIHEWITKAKTLKKFHMERLGEECLKEAMIKYPENEQLLMGYVQILNESGDFKKAIRILEKLTTIAPDKYIYWTGLGMVLTQQGDYARALKYYLKSLEINPNVVLTKLQLAEVYHRSYSYDQRDEILKELSERKDLPLELMFEFALFCISVKKYDYAINALQKIIYKSPQNAEAWFELGLLFRQLKKELKARRCLKKTILFGNDDTLKSEASNVLGLLYAEAWFFKKAINCFIQSISFDPQNSAAWANQTPVYAMLLDFKRSSLTLEISKKVDQLTLAKEEGDMDTMIALMREISHMQRELWDAKFECPFCKAVLDSRPSVCPSCNKSLDKILKERRD